ncbi:sensor histidine kinase [Geoalkalibacter sp.]|uniref:sensor histidine kinase n=1 Tax=Geoalkalibacter sp. TaxID=3041440 RepID=UPI00272E99F2|nr:response regulator [Geoalkalibacter sp.]
MKEKILVVDDEKVILQLTSMILRNKGFEVLTAESGRDGLDLLARDPVPLVLLDYMMPVMDGMTALKQIRERFPATYVIMFTGKGSEEIAVELMKAGASDYVLKPFNNQDLLERIENVLRIRRIELHNQELRAEIKRWNQELEQRVAQKSAELEKAQMEIIQAEKLAAFGHLSAGMAHEIRNPLNSISLFAQILQSGLPDNSDLREYPEKIIKEVDRIDGILRKLLNASKRPHLDLQGVNLAEEIQRALDLFEAQIRMQGVRVVTELAEPPPIEADAHEIAQVFNNLIVNALYEMPGGGCLRISLWHDEQFIYVDLSDSGGGIPKENLYRVFDPFFTTKERGTGLGLSVVLRIIKGYGGRINVESEIGQGTTFHIQLPLSAPC